MSWSRYRVVLSLTLFWVIFILWGCESTSALAQDSPLAAWSASVLDTFAIPDEGQSVHWLTIVSTAHETDADPPLYYDIIAQSTVQVPGVKMLFQIRDDRSPRRLYLNGFQHSWVTSPPPSGPTNLRFAVDRGLVRTGATQATGGDPSQRFDWAVPVGSLTKACNATSPVLYRNGAAARWSCDDRKIILIKRPAVEQKFFGHPLMLAACLTDEGFLQFSGCFYTGLEDNVRMKLAAGSFGLTDSLLTTAFQDGLVKVANDRERVEGFLQSDDVETSWVASMWPEIYRVLKLRDGSFSERADAYTKILQLIDTAIERVDQTFVDQDVVILDPLARGFFLEQVSWDPNAQRSLLLAFGVLRDGYTEPEMEFVLFSRLASLGMGANPISSNVLERVIAGTGAPATQAAFAAHWGLPLDEEGVAAVAQLLATAKLRSAKAEAMDVLILLGAVDRIPEQQLATWCQANLIDTSTPQRRRKLAYLMKTPSGRQFLLSKLADGSLPQELQTLAKSIIGGHVDATQQLKRFDMIDEQELQRLDAAL